MRYVLNGPLREYINKRRTDETKTELTETFLIEMFHDLGDVRMPLFTKKERTPTCSDL